VLALASLKQCAGPFSAAAVAAAAAKPCRFSKGIEARGQLLHDIEQLVRAREAREKHTGGNDKGNSSGNGGAAATRKNVFDYTLDQQREEVRGVANTVALWHCATITSKGRWPQLHCGKQFEKQ
jgi:hypothetical protein